MPKDGNLGTGSGTYLHAGGRIVHEEKLAPLALEQRHRVWQDGVDEATDVRLLGEDNACQLQQHL